MNKKCINLIALCLLNISNILYSSHVGKHVQKPIAEQEEEKKSASQHPAKNKFIVITDLEPDDRIALHVLAARIPKDEILFVGATIKNSALKRELIQRLLNQLGLSDVTVYQGSGGAAASYRDIASSRAAREYTKEGENILPAEELSRLRQAPYASTALQEQIEAALKKNTDVQFIMLAPPTDLVAVLDKNPSLKKHIKHIYIMGGWTESQEHGKTVLRTTYNWNMDPEASAKLMEMSDIPMTLYSSHSIKQFFSGGSLNVKNCPEVIEQMKNLKSKAPSLRDQATAALCWDEHVMEKIPALKNVIEPYKGEQFTPADPLIVIEIANPRLATETEAIDVNIDLNDLDQARGFRVYVTPNARSKIRLVKAIDTDLFKKELKITFDIIAK